MEAVVEVAKADATCVTLRIAYKTLVHRGTIISVMSEGKLAMLG